MYRFRSIKYLAMTGIITGLLVTIGYCSTFLLVEQLLVYLVERGFLIICVSLFYKVTNLD
ncbi:hypothetical protein [Spiroplasma ixodetis]|uniref:Uncharacterized protein n=1 Tax=Spiroplasma ixodetis TaxID=2141 RepID=A0ABM8BX68_9MOLU|nr:hypothetical protein [Spiroplasma ixodetis]BDT04466.1 hypothetical protein SHM_21120 [Spiroplasma ixodetis]